MGTRVAKAKRNKQAAKAQLKARLKLFAALALGLLVVNALAGYWLYQRMVVEVQHERLQLLTEQETHNRARRVQTLLDDWRRRMTQAVRSEEHTSELQSRGHLVCRLLLEKKKKTA